MTDDLKPCPFCGGKNLIHRLPTCRPETPYNPADRLYPSVLCCTCSAEAFGENEDYEGRSAIAAWNTRAPDAALREAANALSEVEGEITRLNDRNVEVAILAHGWMVAHDRRAAGLAYDYPKPADVPEAIARAQSAERERDEALSRVGELEADVDFWCRMMGDGIDALDGIAGRELSDDDEMDYREEASIAADAIRAKYKARSALSPTRGGGDEGTSSQKPTTSAAHGVPARAAPTAEEP